MKSFNKYSVLHTLVLLVLCQPIQAQDVHFSQFFDNPLLRNPALTGIFTGDYRVGVNYRNQWSSVSVPFQTMMLSAETKFQVTNSSYDNISFGLSVLNDKAGTAELNCLQVYPALNYNKFLDDARQSYLSVGFSGGFTQFNINAAKMNFASQYIGGTFDGNNPSNENITQNNISFYDFGAGISLNSSIGDVKRMNYYIGIAGFHLNKPRAAFNSNQKFVRMQPKWNANFGCTKPLNLHLGLTAHINYSLQGNASELISGALLNWTFFDPTKERILTFSMGSFYRLNDAIIPTVRINAKQLTYTISYDINTSALSTVTKGQGALEISIYSRGWIDRFPWKRDYKAVCPRFEDMLQPDFL